MGVSLVVHSGTSARAAPKAPVRQRQILLAGAYTSGEYRRGLLPSVVARLRATVTRRFGIYCFSFDAATGQLEAAAAPVRAQNASWLAAHTSSGCVYAVSELARGRITAFRITDDASLEPINEQPSHGEAPCHLTLDATGRWLLVANYWSGTVALLPIDENGALQAATAVVRHTGSGPTWRQTMAHPHCVRFAPDDTTAIVADLGTDELRLYRLERDSGDLLAFEPHALPIAPGQGPRQLEFHPGGRLLYVLNELGSTIVAWPFPPDRANLHPVQSVSTLPDGWRGSSTAAHLQLHPSGRFLYASNRGHDSIAIFALDAEGRMTLSGLAPTLGRTPRAFAIDPSGRFLIAANQHSGNLVTFSIDPEAGTLTAVERIEVRACASLVFATRSQRAPAQGLTPSRAV